MKELNMLTYRLLHGVHVQAKKTYEAGTKNDKIQSPVELDSLFPDKFELLGELEDPEMLKKLQAFAAVNNKQYEKPAPELPEEDKPEEPEVVTKEDPVEVKEDLYTLEKKGAWYNVVNKETGKALNEKSLRKAEAEALLEQANG